MPEPTENRQDLFSGILDFYLFSNLHIALCSVALVGVTQELFGFHLRAELYVFVFSGTLFLYNLQRLPAAFQNVEIERKYRRHRWNTRNRKLLLGVSIVAMVVAAWTFLNLNTKTKLIAIAPGALSVAYAFPSVYWKKSWVRLREIPFIKIFIIAVVWGISCVWVPAAADNSFPQWNSPEVSLWMIACCVMIFSIAIPFDIRDLHFDGDKLKTMPAVFGLRNSIAIGVVGMLLSLVGVYLADMYSTIMNFHHVLIYGVWTIVTCVVIVCSKPSRHEYYYSFIIDGMLIVLWAMLRWC
jgi:preprotein translocase subunit Sss1